MCHRARHCAFVLVFLAVPAAAQDTPPLPHVPAGTLGRGELWETPWYSVSGHAPGPTVVILGGVHGNEPAGAQAAEQIRHWPVQRGRLVVVPQVNRLGLTADTRWFPPERNNRKLRDLNRNFPRSDNDAPQGPLAEALWKLVISVEPDLIVDLHEGFDFHVSNKKSVGSSVICSPDPSVTKLARLVHQTVNSTISRSDRKFDLLNRSGAASGSIARACANRLGINALILETTFKDQPLSLRTRQHRQMVSVLLREVKLLDRDCSGIVGPGNGTQRLRIGVFDGSGTTKMGLRNVGLALGEADRFSLVNFGTADVSEALLAQLDVLIFSGGSGSKQGRELGPAGRKEIRQFVKSGGGIVGICAGAYLCSSHYDWSLNVINTSVYNKMEDIPDIGRKSMWYRGPAADVTLEFSDAGNWLQQAAGLEKSSMQVRFQNGPIVSPGQNTALPAYEVLARFRSEITKYEVQKGTMIDTPAIVSANFGKGRVLSISPHPEATPSLRTIVTQGTRWAAGHAPNEPASRVR